MNTYRYIANDIRTSLKQIYDDADISMALVVYWMHIFGDALKKQHIEKYSSGAFVSVFRNVPVAADIDTNMPYPFVELPQGIYDYDMDNGIDYITYPYSYTQGRKQMVGNVKFTRTSFGALERLNMREEERPSPSNPYFVRSGERVYLIGVERINLASVEMGLKTTFDVTATITLDDPFDFPEHLLPLLRRQILEMGRFVLMVPDNLRNDGTSQDVETTVPSTRAMGSAIQQQQQQQVDPNAV